MKDFHSRIKAYSGQEIIRVIGCSHSIAYAWLDGTRTPPEYAQRLVVMELSAKGRKNP